MAGAVKSPGYRRSAGGQEAQLASLRTRLDGLTDLLQQGRAGREDQVSQPRAREISRIEGERAGHVSDIASGARPWVSVSCRVQIRKSFHEDVTEELRKVAKPNLRLPCAWRPPVSCWSRPNCAPWSTERLPICGAYRGRGGGASELLLELVPADDRLIVEARYARRMSTGSGSGSTPASALRLRSADPSELDGKVTYPSADAVEDPRTGQTLLPTRIEVPGHNWLGSVVAGVVPGMMSEVFVRTGGSFVDTFCTRSSPASTGRGGSAGAAPFWRGTALAMTIGGARGPR